MIGAGCEIHDSAINQRRSLVSIRSALQHPGGRQARYVGRIDLSQWTIAPAGIVLAVSDPGIGIGLRGYSYFAGHDGLRTLTTVQAGKVSDKVIHVFLECRHDRPEL